MIDRSVSLERMREHFEASCLCGGITLGYTGIIGPGNYCHCEDCRRANGSAFNIGLRVERKDLKVRAISELRSYKCVSGSGREIERCFCARCGSPIFTLHPSKEDYAWVKAGIIDDPKVVRQPTRTGSRTRSSGRKSAFPRAMKKAGKSN